MRWLALAFVAGGVLAPVAADAADIRIEMRAAAYAPADVRGREGDTLTFVNHDAVQHQPFVPTTGSGVNVGDVKPAGTAGFPLARPGQFEIECAYHPGMRHRGRGPMMPTAGRRTRQAAAIGGVLFGSLAFADAGAETVAYPAGYRTTFVEYGVVDAVPVKRVRTFYVAPEVLSAAAPGRPLPDGTVLVMEERDAKLDAGSQPVRDAAGRFFAGDRVVGLPHVERMARRHRQLGRRDPQRRLLALVFAHRP